MSKQTGVACECSGCGGPQWYEKGVCQGCGSEAGIAFTWVAKTEKGGTPSAAPTDVLRLEAGVGAQLADVWTNLVLVRGLSPYLTSSGQAVMQYSSAPWYVERGVDMTVQCTLPTDPGFADKLNRASSWTNQSFLVRIVTTFEAFAGGKRMSSVRLPNNPGMREFHHARRLRNKIAHGDALTDQRLKDEAIQLFGPQAVVDGSCNLDISIVLEPLWARLLLYARSLEDGASVPTRPAVVVAVHDSYYLAQTFVGILKVARSGAGLTAGDVVSLLDSA
ncbi:MAG: hypothetical protein GTN74_08005 [Proteobacteria bacterium]|nr:hypothetical protein [Pseudomonadota bacterium]NIS68210.1 hypothetical protein [Pseudomonadota bacterium]